MHASVGLLPKRMVVIASLALAVGAVLTVVSWGTDEQSATAKPSEGAVHGMSAMNKATTRVVATPALVSRLPGEMAARPGTVHRLLSGVGKSRFSLYAWPGANGESVCYVSTGAGGGCFAEFLGPFNISITDFDQLGSGAPLVVSGPVRDDVVGVEIIIEGQAYTALVRNNVAFFEAPDARSQPTDVERVTVMLKDGGTEDMRL